MKETNANFFRSLTASGTVMVSLWYVPLAMPTRLFQCIVVRAIHEQSDCMILGQHEHPYTGALAVAFDRSEPGKHHSKSSRFAVISGHDAQDRLILNRDGRASKVLANRGMSAMGKKKLRRRPIFMSNLVWRQRLAAMTPLNVVAGGNLHSLRAQVRAHSRSFGLSTDAQHDTYFC